MCVEENTARPANVRAVRPRQTVRAMQSGRKPLCQQVILFDSLNRAAEIPRPCFLLLRMVSSLLHAVFVGGDHLFDHLTADAAGLTGRQITVVALLEVYAHFGGGLHLEAVHRLAGIGVDQIVAVGSSHFVFHLLFVFWVS